MTEEDKAQKLAEWLATPVGTAPPEGLDPEVLAAVVVLRPERAPAPRVKFDEIVGSVTSGPFVAANNNVSMPTAHHRRRGWFLVFVSSGAFAAAAVGLIFIPIAYDVMSSRKSSMDQVAPVAEIAPAAAPAPPAFGGVPEMQAQAPAPDAPGRAADDAPAEPADKGGEARKEEKSVEAPPPPPIMADERAIAEAAPAGGTDASQAMLEALGYVEAAAGPEPAKPTAPAAEPAPTTSMATGSSANAAGKAASKSKSYAEEDDADLARAGEVQTEGSRLKKDAADGVWATRAAGAPADYNSSWYTKYPDVAAAYARGDYESLVQDSRTDVAMDAAWRAATAWRAGGDSGRAMKAVQAGLARSKANTVFRSNLLVLLGDLYTESDRFSSATEAWREAAKLNAAR